MSDAPGGPGWWRASDGKWYPPRATPPAPTIGAVPPPPEKTKGQRGLVVLFAVLVVLVLTAVGALVVVSSDSRQPTAAGGAGGSADGASPTTTASTSSSPITTSTSVSTTWRTTTTTAPKPPAAQRPFAGTGDFVVKVDPPISEPMIVTLTHGGKSNFIVSSLATSGTRLDGLANEIGIYRGVRSVNFASDARPIGLLEIKADGPWTIVFDDPTTAPAADPEGHFEGSGDMVIIFLTAAATPIRFTCAACDANVMVTAWGERREGLVNEIGSYRGTVLVPKGTLLLEIVTQNNRGGPPAWTIDGV